MSARLIHCVAFNPSHFTSLVHLFTHPVVMTHAPLFATAHHVPTLNYISLYSLSHCLALSRSHAESRSLSHQLSHGIFLCQRLTPSRFIPHTSDCVLRDRTIERIDTKPRTVRRTIQHAFNAQVMPTVATPTVTAHTHCCADHCCTTAAPYSTPLTTQSVPCREAHSWTDRFPGITARRAKCVVSDGLW